MTVEIKDPIQAAGLGMIELPRSVTPDEGDSQYEGYYYLKTDEYFCTCRQRPWRYLHFDKKVIVWPTNDDIALLKNAQNLKDSGFNPKIVEYNVMLGKAIPWDDIPHGSDLV